MKNELHTRMNEATRYEGRGSYRKRAKGLVLVVLFMKQLSHLVHHRDAMPTPLAALHITLTLGRAWLLQHHLDNHLMAQFRPAVVALCVASHQLVAPAYKLE